MSVAIGIDLGGTNLRIAAYRDLTDVADAAARGGIGEGEGTPRPIVEHREPVGEPRDPDALVARMGALVDRIAQDAGVDIGQTASVGVGIAAMLRDRRGTVANSPHLRWRNVAFGPMLAGRLGARRPLGVYNDVNAVAYGEYGLGAAAGAQNVLAVYVGTGIGGGLIVDGRLMEGASNCAGEIGHVKVVWDDHAMPCACGGRGCVEAYVGGSYVLRRIRGELAGGARSVARDIAAAAGVEVHAGHVDEAAAAGDAWALGLWQELAPLLAIALGNAIALVNPERLVLGGGLLGRTPVLREEVIMALEVAAPSALLEPLEIVDAILGDDAGLVGSALLAARGVSIVRSL